MSTPHDWQAWLGPAWDEMTSGQLRSFADEADRIRRNHPTDPDDDPEIADARLWGALLWILGETTLEEAGCRYRESVRQTEHHRLILAQVVLMATDSGVAESHAAREAGVDRMTVRKWTGKR